MKNHSISGNSANYPVKPLKEELDAFSAPFNTRLSENKNLSNSQLYHIQDNSNITYHNNNYNYNNNTSKVVVNSSNNNITKNDFIESTNNMRRQSAISNKNTGLSDNNNTTTNKNNNNNNCDVYEKPKNVNVNFANSYNKLFINNSLIKMNSACENYGKGLCLNENEEIYKVCDENLNNKNNKFERFNSYNRINAHSNNQIYKVGNRFYNSELSKVASKSRSNPLLQYIKVGIKSSEKMKSKTDNFPQAGYNNSSLQGFSLYSTKNLLDKGFSSLKDNCKIIFASLALIGGTAFVYNLYLKDSNIFLYIHEFLKKLFGEENLSLLKNIFDAEFYERNILYVCLVSAILLGIVIILLKLKEAQKYRKISREDYQLIKSILEASQNKEDNCDLIGLFENNIIKDSSQKHNLTEAVYKNNVLPLINILIKKENIIEEAEILIQDQPQIVWRLKK